ncbi:MAG: polysaccharide deacetylase family protein [Nitrosomonas ureae]
MNNNFITILMYHALENYPFSSGYTKKGDRIYVLSTEIFREQMEYLFSKDYKTYLFNELSKNSELPGQKIVITFDDGHQSNFEIAFPILKKFGFKAEFFITTSFIGTNGFMTAEQIKLLYDSGMSIGSHGVHHWYLSDLDPKLIESELLESKRVLEAIIQEPIFSFSAPGGRLSNLGISLARKCGYKFICNSEPKPANVNDMTTFIPRYAIRVDTGCDPFKEIVNQREKWYKKKSNKQQLLKICKTILGNRAYERLREVILLFLYH